MIYFQYYEGCIKNCTQAFHYMLEILCNLQTINFNFVTFLIHSQTSYEMLKLFYITEINLFGPPSLIHSSIK